MATCQAIAAKSTGKGRVSFSNISGVQGIIFTESGTVHAEGAGLIDIHPEGINMFKQVYDGPDGAVHNAMDHLFPFGGKGSHYNYTCNTESHGDACRNGCRNIEHAHCEGSCDNYDQDSRFECSLVFKDGL